MFYDLNVPWTPTSPDLQATITFLAELGYNVVALNHTVAGKLPPDLKCPIPNPAPFPVPSSVRLLRRCTLILSDPSQNYRLSSLTSTYDLVALRPTTEKCLQQACLTLDCDLISLDLTSRLPYHFKFKTLSSALQRGVRFEICYAPAILAADSTARRNLISNATQLVRATRGRGIVVSSEASRSVGCRAPFDAVNLTTVWGLGQERGTEAVGKEARAVVVSAEMKRRSYRGVVDVIYGGEKPEPAEKSSKAKADALQQKRKAEAMDSPVGDNTNASTAPISKREQKRQAKKAKLEAAKTSKGAPSGAEQPSNPAISTNG
ncbi:MAG: hypothetical protein M1819_001888 [Sarea resinae]|nr:MAG: hypothetical protein M1819_001888 [Sarea resinae]